MHACVSVGFPVGRLSPRLLDLGEFESLRAPSPWKPATYMVIWYKSVSIGPTSEFVGRKALEGVVMRLAIYVKAERRAEVCDDRSVE